MFIVALVMEICVPKTYDEEGRERVPWYIRICASLLVSTLSGTIGCAVLLHNHVDLGGIDVLHATRAGALGGAILAPGMMFVPLVLVLAITFIFSPLWIAISLGARWLWGGSDTTFKLAGRGFKYSACYCSGGNLQEDDLA
ncbi:hypothetical protein BYT27DRAFT_6745655 [Phlegmacium glaucopus]|nr:hypothetical protein BYT27DRAFT_6745655 [Phlegmacium glaucopus]